MKRLFLFTMFFALTALVFAFTPGLSPDTAYSATTDDDAEKIKKEIAQLSNQWAQAFTHKNLSFVKRIWADDFSFIIDDGTVFDKKGFLAFSEEDPDTYSSSANTAFNVRVYGKNFAVTTGDMATTGKDKEGTPFSRTFRFTNVWVRKNGTWQVVAGHASKLE